MIYRKELTVSDGRVFNYHRLVEFEATVGSNNITAKIGSYVTLESTGSDNPDGTTKLTVTVEAWPEDWITTISTLAFATPEWADAVLL